MPSKRYYEMLDNPLKWTEPLADLVNWSINYENNEPFKKFLDLIGFTEENYGESIGNWKKVTEGLDYSSLFYIGQALIIYSDKPQDVFKWISELEEQEVADA